jgi:sugar phosphate isomerase/epimerase
MILPGLVSVTFRQLSPEKIVDLAVQAGLSGIEWGGDIHVPHGDIVQARRVGDLTLAAGLQVVSYGSYYRVWPQEPAPFDTVLQTALALGAPTIRVWAGQIGSLNASPQHRAVLQGESVRISQQAADVGISVAFEYHANTLTDSNDTARELLSLANQPNLFCYWQPRLGASLTENLASLDSISPWLHHLHVFHWQTTTSQSGGTQAERRPLSEGQHNWQHYLHRASSLPGSRCAMLEFVQDDSLEVFFADAAVLKDLCFALK